MVDSVRPDQEKKVYSLENFKDNPFVKIESWQDCAFLGSEVFLVIVIARSTFAGNIARGCSYSAVAGTVCMGKVYTKEALTGYKLSNISTSLEGNVGALTEQVQEFQNQLEENRQLNSEYREANATHKQNNAALSRSIKNLEDTLAQHKDALKDALISYADERASRLEEIQRDNETKARLNNELELLRADIAKETASLKTVRAQLEKTTGKLDKTTDNLQKASGTLMETLDKQTKKINS